MIGNESSDLNPEIETGRKHRLRTIENMAYIIVSWGRHGMEKLSILLALEWAESISQRWIHVTQASNMEF